MIKLTKGSLWPAIVAVTEQALAKGALVPIPTDYTFLDDLSGARFFVRVLATLSRKDEARKEQALASKAGKPTNPFLPPERDLVVAEVSDTHVAILNKFNVMDHHLLVVTRAFEDQETLLTLPDFEALWACMAEYDSLGFYNGGREAGASQAHKHLQIVPVPLAPAGPAVPFGPLLALAGESGPVPGFPFLHAFSRLAPGLERSPRDAAAVTYELYRTLLRSLGMASPESGTVVRQSRPYCFLMMRSWMLVVPRSREFFEDISFNSLAFAGSLFVRDSRQLEQLRDFGPLRALASVAVSE